jgi:hypothetical protein
MSTGSEGDRSDALRDGIDAGTTTAPAGAERLVAPGTVGNP